MAHRDSAFSAHEEDESTSHGTNYEDKLQVLLAQSNRHERRKLLAQERRDETKRRMEAGKKAKKAKRRKDGSKRR